MNITRTPEAVMRLYLKEVARKGRMELIDEITTSDMVDEANQIFGGPAGRAGLVAHIAGFRKNISDYSLTIHHIVGNDSQAMAWWSFTGRHVGPWLGVPATGARVESTVFSLFDFEEGLISRYRLYLSAIIGDKTVLFDTSKPGGGLR